MCYNNYILLNKTIKIMSGISQLKKYITKNYEKLSKEETYELSASVKEAIEWLKAAGRKNTFRGLDMQEIKENPILWKGFKSRERLYLVNMAFALNKASKYRGNSDIDCVVQEALIGLMRACELYDATTGFAFSTYCDAWIRQTVFAYRQTEITSLKINPALLHLKNKAKKVALVLSVELNRQPTFEELRAKLEVTEKQLKSAFDIPLIVSADESAGSETENATKLDNIAQPETESCAFEELIKYGKAKDSFSPLQLIVYQDLIDKITRREELNSFDYLRIKHALKTV